MNNAPTASAKTKKLKKVKKAPASKKIPLTMENLELIQDLSRVLGLIQAVHDTTKGERRATVLSDAISILIKHLP